MPYLLKGVHIVQDEKKSQTNVRARLTFPSFFRVLRRLTFEYLVRLYKKRLAATIVRQSDSINKRTSRRVELTVTIAVQQLQSYTGIVTA